MNDLNPDKISLIINEMIEEFSSCYLNKYYYGDLPNKEEEAIRIFMNGLCAIFALSLKEVFPQGKYFLWLTKDGGKHLLLNIDHNFYDIRGYVPDYTLNGFLEEVNIEECISLFPYDYFENESFYEDMIKILSTRGKNYIRQRNWSTSLK